MINNNNKRVVIAQKKQILLQYWISKLLMDETASSTKYGCYCMGEWVYRNWDGDDHEVISSKQ